MPPKKKGGKKGKGKKKSAKTPTVIDGVSTEEMTKEQLEEHVKRLREELDQEREERNYFQLERDRVNTFWEITKNALEQSKSELRNKDREMEDREEKHQMEIKVYKQKVKHLCFEQQSNMASEKTGHTSKLNLARAEMEQDKMDLRKEKRELKVTMKEQQLQEEQSVKNIQLKHDEFVSELRADFERRAKEIEDKYDRKMRSLRDELDLRRKTEIHEVEERKNAQINELTRNHEKAFSDIKNFYNDAMLNNLALISTLKQDVEEKKKEKDRLEKHNTELISENKRLVEPLQKARAQVEELQRQLANYEKDKQLLASVKARLRLTEQQLKDREFKYEVMEQRFEKVEAERNELYTKFERVIREVQQKSGFKNLLLEKKLGAICDTLERKEAQLNEVLSASNLDPAALSVVTRKLEDVLDSKNGAIKDLQYELARVCKAHNDLLRTYESKLSQFGIPVAELGFKPLETAVAGQTLGQGTAGLVSIPT